MPTRSPQRYKRHGAILEFIQAGKDLQAPDGVFIPSIGNFTEAAHTSVKARVEDANNGCAGTEKLMSLPEIMRDNKDVHSNPIHKFGDRTHRDSKEKVRRIAMDTSYTSTSGYMVIVSARIQGRTGNGAGGGIDKGSGGDSGDEVDDDPGFEIDQGTPGDSAGPSPGSQTGAAGSDRGALDNNIDGTRRRLHNGRSTLHGRLARDPQSTSKPFTQRSAAGSQTRTPPATRPSTPPGLGSPEYTVDSPRLRPCSAANIVRRAWASRPLPRASSRARTTRDLSTSLSSTRSSQLKRSASPDDNLFATACEHLRPTHRQSARSWKDTSTRADAGTQVRWAGLGCDDDEDECILPRGPSEDFRHGCTN